MNKEQKQLLRDANINPTNEIIADGLGIAYDTYIKFIDGLEHNDITLMDWRYYNDGKAWLTKGEYKWITVRGTNKVKPIFWLSLWEGFFKVSFFFSEKMRSELMMLPISPEAVEIIKKAEPMGKTMKFMPLIFDICDVNQLCDIYLLAQFRKEKL